MINAHVPRPTDVERDLSQNFTEIPVCNAPIETCESKEQREQRIRIKILKSWRIEIQALDRGCTVSVGCKSFAFENIDAAMETVKQYVDNPVAVIKHYGFEEHI